MDFERGLIAMRQLCRGTAWEQEFLLFEAQLRGNLQEERRFGSTEQTRSTRARIVDQLNALALAHLSMSFNELCQGASLPKPAEPTSQSAEPPARSRYKYDAFISYSHKDRDWVRQTLLPQLELRKLRICIDFRDFELGLPSLVNMENAAKRSRHTLLVLSPDWLASEFAGFESLLTLSKDPSGLRRRTLPVMLRECKLPDRLQLFTYLDMSNPADFAAQLDRLVKAIRA